MADGLEIPIRDLTNILFNTGFVGQNWIAMLFVIVATLLIITRRIEEWKTLALPVLVGWYYFGMDVPQVFFTIAIILFILDVISLKMITSGISVIGEGIERLTKRSRLERTATKLKDKMRLIDTEGTIKSRKEYLEKMKPENIQKREMEALKERLLEMQRKDQKENSEGRLIKTGLEGYDEERMKSKIKKKLESGNLRKSESEQFEGIGRLSDLTKYSDKREIEAIRRLRKLSKDKNEDMY